MIILLGVNRDPDRDIAPALCHVADQTDTKHSAVFTAPAVYKKLFSFPLSHTLKKVTAGADGGLIHTQHALMCQTGQEHTEDLWKKKAYINASCAARAV